ncbi:MAG TPA: hypothetical protein VGM56_16110 [Byssovorax sp.]|jgi:hypothetical protein
MRRSISCVVAVALALSTRAAVAQDAPSGAASPPASSPSSAPVAAPPVAAPPSASAPAVGPVAGAAPSPPITPDYDTLAHGTAVVPMHRAHGALMVVGILMTSLGVASTITGAIITASAKDAIDVYCDTSTVCLTRDDTAKRDVGMAMMFGGAIAGGIGFPTWLVAGRMVPVDARPSTRAEVFVSPAEAGLRVTF